MIIYVIKMGFLFSGDSHARGFYIVFFPYYVVLILMSIFFRYKILTLISIVPISILLWKISDFFMLNGPGSVSVDLLLIISLILLIGLNELVFILRKRMGR